MASGRTWSADGAPGRSLLWTSDFDRVEPTTIPRALGRLGAARELRQELGRATHHLRPRWVLVRFPGRPGVRLQAHQRPMLNRVRVAAPRDRARLGQDRRRSAGRAPHGAVTRRAPTL